MKNIILPILFTLIFVCPNFAQFTAVTYDHDKNWFNEGQPLPAEKAMVFKGVLPQGVERVEIHISSAKKNSPLYQSTGTRQNDNEFSLPVNYKLRASDTYDFQIRFFRSLSEKKKTALKADLAATLKTYIDVNLSGKKTLKLLKKSHKTVREMNSIISDALAYHRSKLGNWPPEVSKVVQLKLEQLDKASLDQDYSKKDTTTRETVRKATRQQLITELQEQVERELNRMLDGELLIQSETFLVDNYPTESKENSLAINIGYGGVYLSGDLDDLTYGASPYLGLAFPLGNSVLGSRFLSNTSVTIGLFLENFEDERGNEVTGFLVKRPIYLGLDHKLFKFLRINAGATLLEGIQTPDVNNPNEEPGRDIMIRPYLGLSARIDLSVGLGK